MKNGVIIIGGVIYRTATNNDLTSIAFLHAGSWQQHYRGIGTELMKLTALAAQNVSPNAKYYLWVLEKNYAARKFYENLGGDNYEVLTSKDPDGCFSNKYRYVWNSVTGLIDK